MNDSFSLADTLLTRLTTIGEPKDETKSRIFFIILACSLNPLLFHFLEIINASGFIFFAFFTIIISLVFFYVYSILFAACVNSRANRFEEILNNYFHRMDRPIAFIVLLYCFGVMCLAQMSLVQTAKYACYSWNIEDYKPYVTGATLVVSGICIVFFSRHQEITRLNFLCFTNLGIWVLFTIALIFVFFYKFDDSIKSISQPKFLNGKQKNIMDSAFLPVFYLLVILNCFQSIPIVYKEMVESSMTIHRSQIYSNIRKPLFISLVYSLLFGFLEYATYNPIMNSINESDLNYIIIAYTLTKPIMFILQITLIMFTARSSFIQTFFSQNYTLRSTENYIIIITMTILCALPSLFIYESEIKKPNQNKEEDFTRFSMTYYVIAFLSCLVGLCVPWSLMIRMHNHKAYEIVIFFLVSVGLVSSLFIANLDLVFSL
ncbi:hypothetical protein SteCoe_23345 [Stentor coeruleus]|uniref:Uncharacterized protein n=1 Tax=Stentor coeruleus TaxID=5963 RepID=A0A1R2BK23_9CILI|nr:hypothetical protein SteCoe_23345 [Stentor coeruleus]